jgi:4-amino-4-deoxy-L-arabinose transferase-like glycosyltransferase
VAALAGWLTSPMVYYQTARLSMSHSLVFTLAMAVFWIALRIRDGETRPRWWILLGILAGLMVVTRNVAVIYLAMPAWIVVRKLQPDAISRLGWLILGAAPLFALQMIAWKLLHGSWIVYSYGGERFDFGNLHLLEILFSPLHGWFYWHPITAFGIAAFFAWALHREEGRAWSISLVVMVVLSAAWPTWWLGSSFGYRGLEVACLFVMIGIAVLLNAVSQHRAFRIIIPGLLGVAIVWNLALFALFLTQRIPREAPVTHRQAVNALIQWVTNR